MPQVLIVVPLEKTAEANRAAAEWDPDGGADTFGLVELGRPGQPATHTAACAMLTGRQRGVLASGLERQAWCKVYSWRQAERLAEHLGVDLGAEDVDVLEERDPLEAEEITEGRPPAPGPGGRGK